MPNDEKAFNAFMLAYHKYGGSGIGFSKCLEEYEAAKQPSSPHVADALKHLCEMLSMLANLHPDDHTDAYEDALTFYNAACPDRQVGPEPGFVTRVVHGTDFEPPHVGGTGEVGWPVDLALIDDAITKLIKAAANLVNGEGFTGSFPGDHARHAPKWLLRMIAQDGDKRVSIGRDIKQATDWVRNATCKLRESKPAKRPVAP